MSRLIRFVAPEQYCRDSVRRFYRWDATLSSSPQLVRVCAAGTFPVSARGVRGFVHASDLVKRAGAARRRYLGARSANGLGGAAHPGARTRSRFLHLPPCPQSGGVVVPGRGAPTADRVGERCGAIIATKSRSTSAEVLTAISFIIFVMAAAFSARSGASSTLAVDFSPLVAARVAVPRVRDS
jgi:hypothetical protein